MKYTTVFYLIILFIVNSSCNNNSKSDNIKTVESYSDIKKNKIVNPEKLKIIGDSIEIPSFEIELNFSKKAEEKLIFDKETVIIFANIFGQPKSDPNKEGPINLAYSKIELTDKRKALFENIKFSKATYDSLKDKNIWITVEVSSGRKSINENFLNTDFLEEDVDNVINKKFVLNGKLIGE
jgi:hypothetical protein